jgi:RNA polymerase sigma factor (sigma-70 family)
MSTAFRRWSDVSQMDRPGAWLRRVTINASISWRRRSRSERLAVVRLRPRVVDAPTEPDEQFWAAVRQLPARQRAVMGLFYVEDRSVADVAEILEIAEGTVKATLSKARANLATALSLVTGDEVWT